MRNLILDAVIRTRNTMITLDIEIPTEDCMQHMERVLEANANMGVAWMPDEFLIFMHGVYMGAGLNWGEIQ